MDTSMILNSALKELVNDVLDVLKLIMPHNNNNFIIKEMYGEK